MPSNEHGIPAFLTSVSGDMEADALISLLESYEIPAYKKYSGASGYLTLYLGTSRLGVDIFVPSRHLQDAKTILEKEVEVFDITLDSEEMELAKKYKRKQRYRSVIILLFFIPGIITGLIGLIFLIYNLLI